MAKKESTFVNMTLTLLAITLIASAGLGVVYGLTKEPIAAVKMANINLSIQEVLPAFDNQPYTEMYKIPADGDTLYCYPGKKDGQLIGTAVETFSDKGFGGKIKVIVGFLPDGTINSCKVIEHKETPGLGDKMDKKKSAFANQFDKKNLNKFKAKVKKDGGDVDAITAATISSRAFCDAIQRAFNAYTHSTTDANSGATHSSEN